MQKPSSKNRPAKTRPPRNQVRDAITAGAMIAPAMAIFTIFFFYPLYRLVLMGFHQQNRFGTAQRWVGLSQYKDVLTCTDDCVRGHDFLTGLTISGRFVLLTVPAGIVLGVLLAIAANRPLRGIKIFQTIFSSTVATSTAVASVIFFVLINPQIGYFRNVGFLALDNPETALRGIAVSSIWQNLGLSFIITLAGLQAIPKEIEEAATLDGYGPLRRFFRITVPLISPTLLFLAVILVIFALQAFAQIDILSGGGPAGSTETLVYKIFHAQQPLDRGAGAVMAIGLFVITTIVTAIQFMVVGKRVHYGD